MTELAERIMSRCVVVGDCLVWQGSRDKHGYGHIGVNGKTRTVHKLFYEEMKGKVPEGLELDHLCMNQPCIKIEHLEPVTHKENIHRYYRSRGWVHPKPKPTHCKKGHEFTVENTYTRIENNIERRQCRTCHIARASARYYRLKSLKEK